MDTDGQLIQYFASLWSHLDERARRLVAASKAVELGYGGISRVSRACGLSRVTLTKGVEELQAAPLSPGRIRQEGGGRLALTSNDPGLVPALDSMVEPTARGDPESPLRWTCKSARTLAAELTIRAPGRLRQAISSRRVAGFESAQTLRSCPTHSGSLGCGSLFTWVGLTLTVRTGRRCAHSGGISRVGARDDGGGRAVDGRAGEEGWTIS